MSTEEIDDMAPKSGQSQMVVCGSQDLGQGYTLEMSDSGWSTVTRVVDPDGKMTAWFGYTQAALIGDKVCLSPYFTGENRFILVPGLEALPFLCTGAAE